MLLYIIISNNNTLIIKMKQIVHLSVYAPESLLHKVLSGKILLLPKWSTLCQSLGRMKAFSRKDRSIDCIEVFLCYISPFR